MQSSLGLVLTLLLCLSTPVCAGVTCDGTDDFASGGDILDLPDTTFTIELWVSGITGTETFQYLQSKHASGSGYEIRITATGIVRPTIYNTANELIAQRSSTTAVNTGALFHIAVVFTTNTTTRDSNDMTIYINGAADQGALSHAGTGGYAGNTLNFYLCRLGANYLPATLHHVRIWSGNIGAAAIALAASSRAATLAIPNTLLAEWSFDQCTPGASCHGVVIRDDSGNGLPLTVDDGANNTGATGTGTSYLGATGVSR